MSHNKGVTLLSLIIMIIIMIILAAVSTNVGMSSFQKAQKAKMDAERAEVVKAISDRYGEYIRNKTLNPLLGEEIFVDYSLSGDAQIEDVVNKLVSSFKAEGRLLTEDEYANHTIENKLSHFVKQNIDKMEYSKILSYDDLINYSIENTLQNSKYVVNYFSNEVVGPIL